MSSDAVSARETFRIDVIRGLSQPQKALPCKYFYDAAGSALFERICTLDEYYLTRTEGAILARHVAEMASFLGPRCRVIEYGTGSGQKTRLLLDHLPEPAGYVAVDLAAEALASSSQEIARRYPGLAVRPVCADFTGAWELPPGDENERRRVVYFPGSTVGNLTPAETVALFRHARQLCGPGGGFLLGADLKKEPSRLHAAYNDAAGVTAAFNLNLLARINRELGGTLGLDGFWHHAFYEPRAGRIEMHLLSRADQRARVDDQEFTFAEGESILTEYSYKYTVSGLRSLAEAGGWRLEHVWTDAHRDFAVVYLEANVEVGTVTDLDTDLEPGFPQVCGQERSRDAGGSS